MSAPTAAPAHSPDLLDAVSEWRQDQFERHLRYARSLGLSPDHSRRYARQQLQMAEAARPHPSPVTTQSTSPAAQ